MSDAPYNDKTVRIDLEQIHDAAERSGLSVREIARRAGGMTHSNVHAILQGDVPNPRAVGLKKLCDVFDIPIEDVFIEEAAA